MSKDYTLRSSLWLPQSIDEVFEFFNKAENLQKITPPWLDFEILAPLPIEMKKGALIDYQLKLYGIVLSWQTEISRWEPPYCFVDSQRKGPYRKWVHTHLFREVAGGTLVEDLVEYQVPGGLLAPMIYGLFVKRNVRQIFLYRKAAILNTFGQPVEAGKLPVY